MISVKSYGKAVLLFILTTQLVPWLPTLPLPAQSNFEVLVFSKTEGFRHSSISDGQQAIAELSTDHNFGATFTEDADFFLSEALQDIDVVIFLNTTGDILNAEQEAAFETFYRSGKGFVGVHSATDTEYDWDWYGNLVGTYFDGHPAIQDGRLRVEDDGHPASQTLPDPWDRRDESYNFATPFPQNLQVLLTIDESTYEGGTMGDFHPLSWYHFFDGGRSFYTALGHTRDSYSESRFRDHLLGGIRWAAGQVTHVGELPGLGWELFPSPARTFTRLQSAGQDRLIEEVQLFDPAGRLVRTWQPREYSLRIDLGGLPGGTYLLRINRGPTWLRLIKR